MKVVWSAVIALGMVGIAVANDDDEAKTTPRTYTQAEVEALLDLATRVSKLEEAQQDAELEKLRKAAEKEKQADAESLPGRVAKLEKQVGEVKPAYDASKMLTFATPDGNFTAKIGGRFYVTYRHVFDNNQGPGGITDQFAVDTARFQLDGTFFKDFFYRIEGEAKTNENPAASAPFRTKDVYMGWQGLGDWFAVQAGQFKCTISQEETTSSRFIDFAERSLLNRIVPGHVQGIRFNGGLFDKTVEWYFGFMNGAPGRDGDKGLADTNDEKDFFWRVFLTPFKTMDMGFLKTLRVGYDGSVGKRDGGGAAAVAAVSSGDWGLPGLLPAGAAGTILQGDQTRQCLNLSWNGGPASLRAEYYRVKAELDGATATSGAFHQVAYYVQATYLLTGEDKPLENRVKPFNNFSPLDGQWGAWELAARWCVLDAHDGVSAGVYTPAQNHKATEYTFGVNWWMTPNVCMRIDYERITYDVNVNTGLGAGSKRYEDEIYIRWQIDF